MHCGGFQRSTEGNATAVGGGKTIRSCHRGTIISTGAAIDGRY